MRRLCGFLFLPERQVMVVQHGPHIISTTLGGPKNLVPLADAKGTLFAAVPGLVVSVASGLQQGSDSGHEGARLGDVVEHVAADFRRDEVPEGSEKQVVDDTDVGNECGVAMWLHISGEDSVKLGRIRTDTVLVGVARLRGRGNGFGFHLHLVSDATRSIEVVASR
jgi:hypothetical protein